MERSLFLNRKMILAVLTVLVFVCGLQMMEPTSAAKWKVISKGHKHTEQGFVFYWKTYKKGNNYVKIKGIIDAYGEKIYTTLVLKKISKTKLKIIDRESKTRTKVYYTKTKFSAVKYYWNQRKKGNYLLMWHD